jgi:crotonobetainyl-CoA:carnitine CoA-transferase CaiB-like acyl-CoA transferase
MSQASQGNAESQASQGNWESQASQGNWESQASQGNADSQAGLAGRVSAVGGDSPAGADSPAGRTGAQSRQSRTGAQSRQGRARHWSPGPARPGPLAGLLVADFSRVLAGPYCTMLLADLGADVIKVESPAGDDTRGWVPPVTSDGRSTYFLAINRNKRSVVLDLRDPADLAAARELARRADIFVQNFKPGGLAKFGLDYPSVHAVNPAIIYASISGFGTAGGKDLPGYDLIVQAMSGLMSLTGGPDGPPYRAGISLFDVIAGLHTTIAILAALHHRSTTGEGQHLEASLLASALSGMVNQTSAYAAAGVVPFRMGNSHPSLFPYDPLPTADGDLIVAAGNDIQFRRLCEVIGMPGVADDPRFVTNAGRTANREQLRPLLAEGLRTRTAAEWFTVLNAIGVPCGPINTVDAGIRFARDIGLDPVVSAGDPARGTPTVRHPVSYSATPPDYPLAPPELDEHGEQVRAWLARQPGTPHGQQASAADGEPGVSLASEQRGSPR